MRAEFDAQHSVSASGPAKAFNQAGVLLASHLQVARTITRLAHENNDLVILAAAFVAKALSSGSVCVDLAQLADSPLMSSETEPPALPPLEEWLGALRASPAVGDQDTPNNRLPMRLVGETLYFERYWLEEEDVRTRLEARARAVPPLVDDARLAASLNALVGRHAPTDAAWQRPTQAIERAVRGWTSVVAGGPGTGKTTTVAAILSAIADQSHTPVYAALAAPTGKAAARLQAAFDDAASRLPLDNERLIVEPAQTLHRLLGSLGAADRWIFGKHRQLPYDVIVVDEFSMVSLSVTARLLQATPSNSRLIFVGDPDQLTPVEAGAVLADIVEANPPLTLDGESSEPLVTTLEHSWRFGGGIAELAHAIRRNDADRAVEIIDSSPDLSLIDADPASIDLDDLADVKELTIDLNRRMVRAAAGGDIAEATKALSHHRILCAHRTGPYGQRRWGDLVERALRDHHVIDPREDWYVGRPILVTANNRTVGISNGDTGVTIDCDGARLVALDRGPDDTAMVSPFVLDQVETLYAMTVHKSQGSQFNRVTVVLPEPDSPLSTRAMLYTAVTRASEHVTIVGTRESIRAAIARPSQRASGLAHRLMSMD